MPKPLIRLKYKTYQSKPAMVINNPLGYKSISKLLIIALLIIFAGLASYLLLSSLAVSTLSADFNGDGTVNALDLSILASHWGSTGATKSTGDANSDGTVNIYDLSILAAEWGQTVSLNTGSCTSSATSIPPAVSSDPLYPFQKAVNFTGSTLPKDWTDYGNEVQSPGGYVAASHAVFVPGVGLQIEGYPDPISGSIGGVTGGSGDIDATGDGVASSGGLDVCFSMSSGNWQNVHLVLISWPTDQVWGEGENDFFEGNPQSLGINVHEIGSSPRTVVYHGTWPSSLATGTHLVSARWDPINGYRFYLDGALVITAPISATVTTPTTYHHLCIQMQDTPENSTSTETATIYWTAAYGYN